MDFESEEFNAEEMANMILPPVLEFWAPVEDDPHLRGSEKELLVEKKELIESLHIVKPAVLVASEENNFSYLPIDELGYYCVAACLKNSNQVIIFEDYQLSPSMKKYLKETFNPKKNSVFYMDMYFSPGFGAYRPHYFLFEKVNFTTLPNTIILFREK